MNTPTSAPKPRPPKAPSPAALAGKAHPVKIPVLADVDDQKLAEAARHGAVEDGDVVLREGKATHVVGKAKGDDPVTPYARRYFEHIGALERLHARLETSDLTIRDIDAALKELRSVLETPDFVGDVDTLRSRLEPVEKQALELREKLAAERAEAKAGAITQREEIVARAEAIAGKAEDAIHWKDDSAELRDLLDRWKAAQHEGVRIGKDVEKQLWERFAHARSGFEKLRKRHFADLDKSNAEVAARKEALAARAEALSGSRDWDSTARAFRDLMTEWKAAGRGRRSTDDALWERFKTAQDAFFAARHEVQAEEREVLSAHVAAKEAAVVEAESILPVRDLTTAKATLRGAQSRFEAAGEVPRPDAVRLNKRMSAVERAVREAEDAEWDKSNPELEARASGAAQQLVAAIADLDHQIAEATRKGDKDEIANLTEARDARQAWLAQIQSSVS